MNTIEFARIASAVLTIEGGDSFRVSHLSAESCGLWVTGDDSSRPDIHQQRDFYPWSQIVKVRVLERIQDHVR